jgi:AraC-like DNA-binding protein
VPVAISLPSSVREERSAKPPHEFITKLRIDRAKRLLAREQLPVTDVCFAVGYESLGSFSTRFRTLVGYSPSVYQREIRRIFPFRRWPSTASFPIATWSTTACRRSSVESQDPRSTLDLSVAI